MNAFIYSPGTYHNGGMFRPVVRVFRDGKPVGSKTTGLLCTTRGEAELAATDAAFRAAAKVRADGVKISVRVPSRIDAEPVPSIRPARDHSILAEASASV